MQRLGATGDDPRALAIGDVLGERYRLVGVLGRGGMGTVYRAEHVALGGELAVKVLLPAFASHPEYLRRFRREGRAAMQLDHPHVVRVVDLGLEPPVAYLAMELVKGESLGAWIDGVLAGHRPVAAVCELLAQPTTRASCTAISSPTTSSWRSAMGARSRRWSISGSSTSTIETSGPRSPRPITWQELPPT